MPCLARLAVLVLESSRNLHEHPLDILLRDGTTRLAAAMAVDCDIGAVRGNVRDGLVKELAAAPCLRRAAGTTLGAQ